VRAGRFTGNTAALKKGTEKGGQIYFSENGDRSIFHRWQHGSAKRGTDLFIIEVTLSKWMSRKK
jgi:hypothetical protein